MKKKIAAAAKAVLDGELIIFPTETVYALACHGFNATAKNKIYALKGRNRRKPLQLLLPDMENLAQFADLDCLKPQEKGLLRRSWPGPLTAILPATPAGEKISGGPSIGIRIPDDPAAQAVLKATPAPIAATSANLSHGPEPARFAMIPEVIKKAAKCKIWRAGKTRYAEASTVIDCTRRPWTILRCGALKMAVSKTMTAKAKHCVLFVCTGNTCRSVLAEYLMKKMAPADIEAGSAGIYANPGFPIPASIFQLMQEEDIKNFNHTPRPVTQELVGAATLILAMERAHKNFLLAQFPQAANKIFLLKEFAANAKAPPEGNHWEIGDPIGAQGQIYKHCRDEIKESVKKTIARIQEGD